MANLAAQLAAVTGLNAVLGATAPGGDTFDNNGLVVLQVNNPTGAPITVTFDDPGTPAPAGAVAFNADVAVAIPAAATRIIGPFPPWRFNNPETGRVSMTYSGAGLTMAVIQIRT